MFTTREAKNGSFAGFEPAKDVERLAQLVMTEARASLANAGRIIGKMITVATLGFLFASDCCSCRILVPVGVVILAMAAGWLDALGNECSCQRFFPDKRLNSIGSSIFRWQWIVFWTCAIFATSFLRSGAPFGLSQLEMHERLWLVTKLAVVPTTLMLLCRSVEPFRFGRIRADLQKAEVLVRQLAAKDSTANVDQLAPLIESEMVPFYKLGSVAKLLYNVALSYDAKDKLNVNLSTSHTVRSGPCLRRLSTIYAPLRSFRTIANNLLLWESEDSMLYIVIAVYFGVIYVGSNYSPWGPLTPFCLLVPFLGPKSKAGRYVRALQEDVRLVQGRHSEKKGGMDVDEIPENETRLNWPMVVYIGGSHVTALWAIVVLMVGHCPLFGNEETAVKRQTVAMSFILYVCSGLGITAGAHRLWSHKSYQAALPLRFLLMIFNSIASQGTIYHWARDHRLHHKYSDTPADPHDANRGFWFSHVGWLLTKKNSAVIKAGKEVNVSDLKADGVVMFQKKADPFWNLFWCFGFPGFLALLWADTFWNGFLVGGVLRYCLLLNATWAVNSVVHAFGNRPYNASHPTTENGWVSLFALGEGWHNWHHAFAWDYATSELGPLQQFNPTKVFIDLMAVLGLAWGRKRAHNVWESRKSRWEKEQGRPVLESLEGPPLFKHRVVTFGGQVLEDTYGEEDKNETWHDAAVETRMLEHEKSS